MDVEPEMVAIAVEPERVAIAVEPEGPAVDDAHPLDASHPAGAPQPGTEPRPVAAAVDIDQAAVTATRANAADNQVQVNAGLPHLAAGEYPVVLANILAAPLRVLAPLLCGHLAPGGSLVLAGLLERQIDELVAAYTPWLQLEVADRQDGWALLHGRRLPR